MSDNDTTPLLGEKQQKKYKLKDEKTNSTPETSIKYQKLKGTPSPSPSHSPEKKVNNRLSLYKPRSLFNFNGKK